ncbi:hypothetical protein J7413_19970 [Shimia sp. R10_1]|uniref:hypothetical protein n=1 Tax=Shimia sp. R10_1 TaxID=2821095 RepID=UPI001AD97F94|nr:hypothetical protein [Shimia sp. R10_1]MBO9475818.1 hypothetical protein [Shimia sp. R10_1]
MIVSIEHNRIYAVLRFQGVVTHDEIVEARREIIDHSDYKLRKYHVWIFDNVTEMRIGTDQMKVLRTEDATNSAVNPNLRVALVGNTDIGFGTLRMYESYVSTIWRHVGVFRDEETAFQWAKMGS